MCCEYMKVLTARPLFLRWQMLLIGIEPRRVCHAIKYTTSFLQEAEAVVWGQSDITGFIFQNLDLSLKIHKRQEVKRLMDSSPQPVTSSLKPWSPVRIRTTTTENQINTNDACMYISEQEAGVGYVPHVPPDPVPVPAGFRDHMQSRESRRRLPMLFIEQGLQ